MGKRYLSEVPHLLAEWDYEANKEISPEEITSGNSYIHIGWKCTFCGNTWRASAYSRIGRKSGCPECAKKTIGIKNRNRKFDPTRNLLALFPDIASEWHHEKNRPLEIAKVMPGSDDKVWWLCSTCGNEYSAKVCNRTKKRAGCPLCNRYLHTSFAEQAVFYYLQCLYPDAQNKYTEIFDNQMELDIFLPGVKIGIEYDGRYWHKQSSQQREKRKYAVCKQHGIYLIRIKENYEHEDICEDDCDYNVFRYSKTDDGLKQALIELFKALPVKEIPEIDISGSRTKIKNRYITSYKAKSLLAKYPDICEEWHTLLNDPLTPDMVLPSAHEKVWWLCPKCGEAYLASPAHRTRVQASGCSICAGKRIVAGINDLATRRPDLAAEWHPTLNGTIKPNAVAPNYSKKVWWKCRECGCAFFVTANKRISRGQGCPECAKKAVKKHLHNIKTKKGVNDLASQHPNLLKEWDYDANASICTPDEVTVGNGAIAINWICATCGHKWQASAYSRTHLKSGCKMCADKEIGRKNHVRSLKKGINDLASQRPDLLTEWDYEKNTLYQPDEITIGNSSVRANWVCSACGYSWQTSVYNRVHHNSGCRKCSRRKEKKEGG